MILDDISVDSRFMLDDLLLIGAHWIGWWENLQENPIFHGKKKTKKHGFL